MNKTKHYITTAIGLILLLAGLVLVLKTEAGTGIMGALPYVLVGLGCLGFGHGMGSVVTQRTTRKHADVRRQMDIERKDERNIAIANAAKAKAYDVMLYVFGALLISFGLMQVDMVALLLLALAYLFVVGYGIYYRTKYDKEM